MGSTRLIHKPSTCRASWHSPRCANSRARPPRRQAHRAEPQGRTSWALTKIRPHRRPRRRADKARRREKSKPNPTSRGRARATRRRKLRRPSSRRRHRRRGGGQGGIYRRLLSRGFTKRIGARRAASASTASHRLLEPTTSPLAEKPNYAAPRRKSEPLEVSTSVPRATSAGGKHLADSRAGSRRAGHEVYAALSPGPPWRAEMIAINRRVVDCS